MTAATASTPRRSIARAARRLQPIFAVVLLAAVLVAPARVVHASRAPAGERQKPNVLIIVTDDQREGLEVMPKTLAWFGQGRLPNTPGRGERERREASQEARPFGGSGGRSFVPDPPDPRLWLMPKTIAWLRGAGTLFTNAFTPTPLCCPARASIFTGRYAHNHGVRTNPKGGLIDRKTTMQHYLHDAGYRTGLYGKYLQGWPIERPPPDFDRYAMLKFCSCPRDYGGGSWNVQGSVQRVNEYVTSFIGRNAVSFLDSSRSAPWFLYLAVPNPHPPFVPEPKYAGAAVPPWHPGEGVFEADRSDKPPYVQARHGNPNGGRASRLRQFRTLMSVDDMIDRILEQLARTGQLDRTLVLFTSDNGYMWGEHGWIDKRVPYTESIRVPLLAHWPQGILMGPEDQRLVSSVDIAPTVLRLARVRPAHELDGRSLLGDYVRKRILTEYWNEGLAIPSWASIRTREGQYVEYYDSGGRVTFTEYYDLLRDPAQLENLRRPPSRWREQLEADRACVGRACP